MRSLQGGQTPSQHVLNRTVQSKLGWHGPQVTEKQPAMLAASAVMVGTNAVNIRSPSRSNILIIGIPIAD